MFGSWKSIATTRDGSFQLLELWGPVCEDDREKRVREKLEKIEIGKERN